MARIRLVGVTKRFAPNSDVLARTFGGPTGDPAEIRHGRIVALDNLDLEIRDGETLAVIGPSGCGKSTLLRVVAGLELPESGKVYYDDRDMDGVPPKDRGIGMVFQNYALYPHMESEENVGFFFRLRHREREIPERVKITAEIMGVGFEELLAKRPKELSGGQQQRVAIARCISRDPTLFLLDEPLSNLDAKLRARTRVEIKRLLRRFAITTIYVTHDQTEAVSLGDRIAVMNYGKIEQIGTFRELYDQPANLFVATFVGTPTMNVLRLRVSQDGRLAEGESTAILLQAGLPLQASQAIAIGIRPDAVSAAMDGSGAHLQLAVEVLEPLVQERSILAHGKVAGQTFVATLPDDTPVHVGDTLSLGADPEQVHVFDVDTHLHLSPVG